MFIDRYLSRAFIHKQGRHAQALSQLRARRGEQRGDLAKKKKEDPENADDGRQPTDGNNGPGKPIEQCSEMHRPQHQSESLRDHYRIWLSCFSAKVASTGK